jgi:membrane-associated phospholipid phosphatase
VSRLPRGVAVISAWLGIIAVGGIVLGRIITTGPLGRFVARNIDAPTRRLVTGGPDLDWQHPVWPHPLWHDGFAHVAVFGTAAVTAMVAVGAGLIWSLRTHNPLVAMQLAIAFVGAAVLTVVVKFGVNRDPASGPISHFAAGTFPSGHALFAVAVYGTLAVVMWRSHAPRVVTVAVAVLLAGFALVVGAARVYLLDHYASDVIGSVLIGAAWVAVVVTVPLSGDSEAAARSPKTRE